MSDKILGIYREVDHSPNREFDDHEILRLTGQHLADAGLDVVMKKPEEVLAEEKTWAQDQPRMIFMMCEKERILHTLQGWGSSRIVNPVQGIFNTYRFLTIPKLIQAGVPVPASEFVSAETDQWTESSLARRISKSPIWVKRADVHNTQAGDVSYAASLEEIEKVMQLFRGRNIARAAFQQHVPGDLIKFYGVSDFSDQGKKVSWFQWFYHKNQDLKNHPFSKMDLQKITQKAAKALDLNVYGGDAIVTPQGDIYLIDINAWPSFALFRAEASRVISRFLLFKLDLVQKV